MNPLTLASIVSLLAILVWTAYNVPILIAGLRRRERVHAKPKRPLKFTIIIPAKDEERVIARCLRSILNQRYPKDMLEVIVVDGRSKDSTFEICKAFSSTWPGIIKVYRQDHGQSKAAALNEALQHAKGDVVGIFDADSLLEVDLLACVASYFEDPDILALQGRTLSINAGQNMLTKLVSLEETAWFRALLSGRDRLGLFVPFTGSCMFIRREVVDDWNEDSLGEDIEMALRLAKRGIRVVYADDVRSWQESPARVKAFFSQRVRWFRGYVEAGIRYGKLLRAPSKMNLDAEMMLAGPLIASLVIFNILLSLLSTIFEQPLAVFPWISPTLLVLSLSSLGLALAYSLKPKGPSNLLWLPFVYVYWILIGGASTWALVEALLRRPRTWRRTEKEGIICAPVKV